MNILWVFIGGGIGASLRYLMSIAFSEAQLTFFGKSIPWATLACNLIGCLLLGLITALLLKNPQWETQQSGDLTTGLFYASFSIILGVIFCATGYSLANQ